MSHLISRDCRFFVTGKLLEMTCQTNVVILVNIVASVNRLTKILYLDQNILAEILNQDKVFPDNIVI